jgi:hypothetical protein
VRFVRILTKGRWLALFTGLLLIVAFVVMPATADKKHQISGNMTMIYPEQQKIEVGDTEEHILSFGMSDGTNQCTGEEHTFMDGAQVVNMAFSDLVRGNGPHQGYAKFTLGEDAVFAKWEGMITTTVPEEGEPLPEFEGNFVYVKGTGQFENIQGKGTYKGQFISKTEYTTAWEGEYSIEK